jgi:hypothetical protein
MAELGQSILATASEQTDSITLLLEASLTDEWMAGDRYLTEDKANIADARVEAIVQTIKDRGDLMEDAKKKGNSLECSDATVIATDTAAVTILNDTAAPIAPTLRLVPIAIFPCI